MALLIDPPIWPAHDRLWSHLVSDSDLTELHAFAAALGIPRRAFEGDHYDIPQERYAVVVAAGARPVGRRELLGALTASGLRMQKRLGDKGIARRRDVLLASGTTADIDLIESSRPFDERRVFAALVFLDDARGDLALVHSVRRQEWGSPGGWREPGESVPDNALREVREETGLVLTPEDLKPCGYERFTIRHGPRVIAPGQDVLQAFRATVAAVGPQLHSDFGDTSERAWVSRADYERRCGHLFWWPLAARVLALE